MARFADLTFDEQIAYMREHHGDVIRAVVAAAPPPPAGAIEMLRACGFPFRSTAAVVSSPTHPQRGAHAHVQGDGTTGAFEPIEETGTSDPGSTSPADDPACAASLAGEAGGLFDLHATAPRPMHGRGAVNPSAA